MVDLFLQLKHLPEDKRRSFKAENAIADVVKKYPILEVKNGDVSCEKTDKSVESSVTGRELLRPRRA